MSLETLTFTEELKKLDESHSKVKENTKKLRDFILSTAFLTDYIMFETVLGEFQDNLITFVEVIQTPMPSLPPFEAEAPTQETLPPQEKKEGSSFGVAKALVVVAAIAASGFAVQQGYLPVEGLIGVIAASMGLLLLPYIQDAAKRLLQKKTEEEEEKPVSMRLEDWIHESIAKIRTQYTAARFLTKVQSQSKTTLPDYGVPGLDEALYSRGKYFSETMPSEFLSRIGEIVVACEKNYWTRKTILINAISITKQASAKGGNA
jgi:hypothetical protein